ncbi:MAG: type VI secretion system-associated FHA domain protein TagH, partial [Acetobacteraceae bacterium]|nr:type VI secretion system-associated FHA domain protein TagH [Acetobacteraceae bacterium]
MLLLEVISEHKVSMGANARRCIDEGEAAEFTIGRLETCSWVLPQDYVSRVQAVLRCINNMYFLERKGSAPLAINDRSRPIERNRIVRLSPGDVILIDDIEILTSELEPGALAAAPADLPAAVDPQALPGVSDPKPGGPAAGDDIMSLIRGESRQNAPTGPGRVRDPLQPSSTGSVLDFAFSDSPAPPSSPGEPQEDRWWEDEGPGATGSLPRPAAPQRVIQQSVTPPPVTPQPVTPQPARVPSPGRSERVEPPAPARPSSAGVDVTLEEILRGAGLDPARAVITPEVARQLGEVLRLVVGGTMEILRARNDIRRELRIPSTQLAPGKNNPLKFSADVDDALHKLFIQRAPSYLDTVSAFREAFNDIRDHQLALLKSVGVAFDYMLAKFDPKELERQLQVEVSRPVLGLAGKAKPWEAYARWYAELAGDHDHTYRK